MPPEIDVSSDRVTECTCDAIVIAAKSSDDGSVLGDRGSEVDTALDGAIGDFIKRSNFKGKVGEVQIIPTFGKIAAGAVAVVGVGSDPSSAEVRRAAGAAARRLSERTVVASTLHDGIDDGVRAAAEGFLLGGYRFTKYRSDPDQAKTDRIVFLDNASKADIER
ncbi:MAG: M17 family peptidase N-terminal domain-containing protein, partial [Acidimicrobiia bacterium]